jgi:hypothetical protein
MRFEGQAARPAGGAARQDRRRAHAGEPQEFALHLDDARRLLCAFRRERAAGKWQCSAARATLRASVWPLRDADCCAAGSSSRVIHPSAVGLRDAAFFDPLTGTGLTYGAPLPSPQELFTQLEEASNGTSALVVVHWLAHWTDASKAAQARFSSMCRQLPTVMFVEVAVEASVENKSLALEKVRAHALHMGAAEPGHTRVAAEHVITVLPKAGADLERMWWRNGRWQRQRL